ncbi:MAG TPA: hypothetical protein VHO46_02725, partial [Bacteroidales bacterium]|nr:hypothetical protein [Bacteroidales bacterium]
MMKKSVIYCASLLMLVSGCTKKEYHQYDLKSDLNLKVLSYSEFGQQVNDKANFEVLVEGSVPEIRVVTDTG